MEAGEMQHSTKGEFMRRVVVSMYVALDGVMEAPERWAFQFWNDELATSAHDELHQSDALLLGRVTYEAFAEFWPTATNEPGIAERMNNLPKYVVSTTLEEPLAWSNSTLINGDIAENVSKLKRDPGGDILLLASAALVQTLMEHDLIDEYRLRVALVQTLMEHDLIDEYRLRVAPAIAGSGKRLFVDGGGMKTMKLVEAKTFGSGVVSLTYRPAGINQ
jgi:dihydrofolate reductase